jgi:methyl-accepting chemotaxis protein
VLRKFRHTLLEIRAVHSSGSEAGCRYLPNIHARPPALESTVQAWKANAPAAAAAAGIVVTGLLAAGHRFAYATAVAIVVAVGVAAFVVVHNRRDDAELRETAGLLRAIAAGDLTANVPAFRSPRARAIGDATSDLIAQLRTLLTENQRVAKQLGEQWQRMNDVAWSMMSMSEGTVKDVTAAAASAAEVSERMAVIASGAEETAVTIKDVADHASQASTVAAYGARQASTASRTFEDLQEASGRVESIVKLIVSIASQTHLLALNATIEAARAGEHGRGFAVVAGEVKQLAEATAHATDDVITTMQGIKNGSQSASEAMAGISTTIDQVNSSQSAIAAAVVQQTAVTESIGTSTAIAAERAITLAANVKALTDAVRLSAYAGAQARTLAADAAGAENALNAVLDRFTFEPVAIAETQLEEHNGGVTMVGGVTTVQNYVVGTGLNQFNYQGKWGHATANVEADGTNSHSSMPGDTASLRFVGTRIRFFGVAAANHGMATVSVDGGQEFVIDQYAENRVHGVMNWESPVLPRGEHTFVLKVLGESNPSARYVWINVDRVEVVD